MAKAVGDKGTAAWANSMRVLYLTKAASESVTSSTTLQDDNDFVFTIPANKVYLVEAHLCASGAATGDLRVAWAVSGGVATLINRAALGSGIGTTDLTDGTVRTSAGHPLTTALQYGCAAGANAHPYESFAIETTTAGTSGTLKLQWAQWTSSATATTLTASSFMLLREIELWT